MFTKLKDKSVTLFKDILQNLKKYLPVSVMGILLCIIVNTIYGSDMMCIAVVCVIALKELFETTFNIMNYIRQFALLLTIITVGMFAGMNLFAATGVNLLIVGIVSFIFCDNFRFGGLSFNICLQLLIMEYARAMELYRVPFAYICTLLCFGCCVVFLFLYHTITNTLFPRRKDNPYVLDGCKAIANKIKLFLNKENVTKDRDLFLLTKEFCKTNYNPMANQGYLLDEMQKKHLLSLMALQQLSDLIHDTKTKLPELTDSDVKYFEELYRVFTKIKSLKRLAIELNAFVEDYSLSNKTLSSLWKKYLLSLANSIKLRTRPVIKSRFKQSWDFRVAVLKKRLSLSSYNMRKSIQIAVAVAFSTLLGQILPITDAMILPVTTLAVLSVYPETKLFNAFKGTVGIVITCILYMLVLGSVPFYLRIPLTFIFTVIAFMTVNNTFMKAIFSTLILSVVVYPTAVIGGEVFIKSAVILAGFCISWLAVRFVINTPVRRQYRYHISDLAQTDWTAMHLLENAKLNSPTSFYLCELMFLQHLMVENINDNPPADHMENDKIRYSGMLSFNCDLLSEIAYALTVLRPVVLPNEWIIFMKKRLTNIF